MRKIIFQMMVTLDGFFEGANKDITWSSVDDEWNDYAGDLLSSIDALLWGRTTYELMAAYWPTSSAIADDPIIAGHLNRIPKVVFSTTLQKVEWNNTRLVTNNAVEEVAKLKAQAGRNLAVGGSDLAVSLIKANLIDDYRIFVNPVVLGAGKTLLRGIHEHLRLKLLTTRVFKSGLVGLYYEPMR
jgi:dihydrofolate reductase